jgi:hypothetical protein
MIIILGVGIVLMNIWLGWVVKKDTRGLGISRDEYQQGQLFNQELVAQRDELLSRKTIEKKAAVLGLFRPGKRQTRRP